PRRSPGTTNRVRAMWAPRVRRSGRTARRGNPRPPSRRAPSAGAGRRSSPPPALARSAIAATEVGRRASGSWFGSIDDRAQEIEMPGKGPAAVTGGADAGLRPLADEALVDRHVAGLGQGIEVGAEIAVGRLDDRLEPGELEPALGFQGVE